MIIFDFNYCQVPGLNRLKTRFLCFGGWRGKVLGGKGEQQVILFPTVNFRHSSHRPTLIVSDNHSAPNCSIFIFLLFLSSNLILYFNRWSPSYRGQTRPPSRSSTLASAQDTALQESGWSTVSPDSSSLSFTLLKASPFYPQERSKNACVYSDHCCC